MQRAQVRSVLGVLGKTRSLVWPEGSKGESGR